MISVKKSHTPQNTLVALKSMAGNPYKLDENDFLLTIPSEEVRKCHFLLFYLETWQPWWTCVLTSNTRTHKNRGKEKKLSQRSKCSLFWETFMSMKRRKRLHITTSPASSVAETEKLGPKYTGCPEKKGTSSVRSKGVPLMIVGKFFGRDFFLSYLNVSFQESSVQKYTQSCSSAVTWG